MYMYIFKKWHMVCYSYIYKSQILTNHFSHILELGLPPLSESWEQPVCLQVIIIEGDEWLGNGTQVQVQLLF